MNSQLQSSLFLGIDGGGTNCRARLVDAGGVTLGEGRAGTANTIHGIAPALDEVMTATRAALAEAGLGDHALHRIHAGLGLAGLSITKDRDAVNNRQHPFASLIANCDAHIACLGVHKGADGGIAIFGTGSCGYALKNKSKTIAEIRVGGWGFKLSDQGSGAHLGFDALRRALLDQESGTSSSGFVDALLAKFDHDAQQALTWAETAKPADFGSLAPIVVEWAQKGDSLAITLMQKSGGDAALVLQALINQGVDKIALTGGYAPIVREWLPKAVQNYLVPPLGDPMAGAILMARQHAEEQV